MKTVIFEIGDDKAEEAVNCLNGLNAKIISIELVRFDGYLHIDEKDRCKFPEPTVIDMSDKLLKVCLHNPYLEDAIVNGETDDEVNPKIPGFENGKSGYDSCIKWNIDIDTGNILNWIPKTTAKVYYKIVDEFEYDYDSFHYGPDYVPDFMGIDDKSFGDYVCMTIDENGKIKNWSKDKFLKIHNEYVKANKD